MSKLNKRQQNFHIGPVFFKSSTKTLEKLWQSFVLSSQFIEIHYNLHWGKIKFYLHFELFNLLCYIYRYTCIKIKPELQKNVLKFGYGINYKYEGMLAHSLDRFYVVTKLILPTMDDLKLSPINYDKECRYLEIWMIMIMSKSEHA